MARERLAPVGSEKGVHRRKSRVAQKLGSLLGRDHEQHPQLPLSVFEPPVELAAAKTILNPDKQYNFRGLSPLVEAARASALIGGKVNVGTIAFSFDIRRDSEIAHRAGPASNRYYLVEPPVDKRRAGFVLYTHQQLSEAAAKGDMSSIEGIPVEPNRPVLIARASQNRTRHSIVSGARIEVSFDPRKGISLANKSDRPLEIVHGLRDDRENYQQQRIVDALPHDPWASAEEARMNDQYAAYREVEPGFERH